MHGYKCALVMAACVGPMAVAQTGGIAGTVTGDNGSPLAGAAVTYRRIVAYLPNTGGPPQLAPGEVHFDASASTTATGAHVIQGLPRGLYQVCVSAPKQPILDPCHWAAAVPSVLVQSGVTAALNIQAKLGVFLTIRINDPLGLLPASEKGPLDFPHLITGVIFGSGAFLAASRISSDANGQTYQVAVPAGVPLNLWLHTRYVLLADGHGNPLVSTGAKIPFQAVAGVDQSFTINVTGRAP